jgi:hypothetical protein
VMQMATAIVKTVSRYPNWTSFAKKFFLYCFSILFSFFTANHDQTQQRQKRIKLLYLLSELAIASHSKKWPKVPFTIKSQLLYQLSYRGNQSIHNSLHRIFKLYSYDCIRTLYPAYYCC